MTAAINPTLLEALVVGLLCNSAASGGQKPWIQSKRNHLYLYEKRIYHQWKGTDNVVRVVSILTKNGVVKRSVTKVSLYLLTRGNTHIWTIICNCRLLEPTIYIFWVTIVSSLLEAQAFKSGLRLERRLKGTSHATIPTKLFVISALLKLGLTGRHDVQSFTLTTSHISVFQGQLSSNHALLSLL
ncbi:hypothetical protein JTB14_013922 [Gonioctena quinquepunctata]|nr:hypothetical protein JTB14_013922 [Gonioctena quinquepunctata]